MEMYIGVNALFKKDNQNKYVVERIHRILAPLSQRDNEDFELGFAKAVGKFGPHSKDNHRFESLSKMYPDCCFESATIVSPHHIRFQFMCGGDGFDLAEDFCFAIFRMGAMRVYALSGHDEDSSESALFELDRNTICKIE